MTGEVDRAELRREEIARFFTNHRPLGTALARATLTEEEHQKARLFVITHAYGAARTSALEHRERLTEAAGLIPGFGAFRQWCLEDIKAAWLEDREKGTRQAKNRRLAWLHLLKPFARLHKIGEALEIRAFDRQGNYTCELVEKPEPDRWRQLVRLAEEFGIAEHDLAALAEETRAERGEDRRQEAAQA